MNAATNRKPIIFAVVAFLLGVAGTVFAMNSLRPNPAPSVGAEVAAPKDEHAGHDHAAEAPRAHTDEPKDEHAGEAPAEEGIVKLTPEGEKTIGIRMEIVSLRDLREGLTVPAVVEAAANRVAKITPPVAGKIVRVMVRPGDAVRVGQPLAVLESYEVAQAHAAENQAAANIRQAESAIQTARAESVQTRTRLANAQKALVTQQDFAKTGAFAQAPLIAARTELADAQSELLSAQKEAQSHLIQLQRTERLFKEGIVSRSELEQAQLERQQDEIKVTRASGRVEGAKATLAREGRVAQGGLLNRQAVQTAEAEVRTSQSEIARAVRQEQAAQTSLAGAKQALTAATANLRALEGRGGHAAKTGGGVTIFSPISGVVSVQSATLGETVERSATLFQIEDLSSVVVEANVPEKDIAKVKAGLPVTVSVAAYPGERFTGVVQSLASSVDEKTRALVVRCVVANPSRHLRLGMFASVSFPVGAARAAVAVPSGAIVTERGEGGAETPVVFVAGLEEHKYEKRKITPGQVYGAWTEIAGGLKPGEKVVTEGAYALLSELGKGALGEEGHAH